jgi:multidrug efflux pump subunit AcrA (membrane-fusion protein)
MWKKLLVVIPLMLALLASCGNSPTPLPPPALTATPLVAGPRPIVGDVIASGMIVPAEEAYLAFTTPGRVQQVLVAVGDQVEVGDVVAVLETTAMEGEVARAEADVAVAEANLAYSASGPRPEEITAAEQAVATARSEVAQALAALNPVEAEYARAEAGIELAKAALQVAQAEYRQVTAGANEAEIAAAQAEIELAEARRRQAQAAFDRVAGDPDIWSRSEALALEQATIAYEAAQASHQGLLQGATAAEREAALARIRAAQAEVARAENLALASSGRIVQAEAAVEVAKMRQAQAEQQVELAGLMATTEELAIAEAQVARAKVAVQIARAAMEMATLRAPVAGTITSVNIRPGETVVQGSEIVALADLSQLLVETTDLSERDVARVQVGQPAVVFVEALDEEIPGRVVSTAPQASIRGEDAVFTVYVSLDEQPSSLRWGMGVEVEIAAE